MTPLINYAKGFIYGSNPLEVLEKCKASDRELLSLKQSVEELHLQLAEIQKQLGKTPSPREEREKQLLHILRDMAPAWNLDPKNIFLEVNNTFYEYVFVRQMTETGGRIEIPPYYLLKASDLTDFAVSGPSDPKLFDEEFLKKAKCHIETILEIKDSQKLGFFDKQALRIFLVSMRDPEKWEAAKLFIFGHELEHLRLHHLYDRFARSDTNERFSALAVSCALFAYLYSSGKSVPRSLAWASVAGLVSKWAMTKWCEQRIKEVQEAAADKAAVEKTHSLEGFTHYLTTIVECNKASRHASKIYSTFFCSQGEWRLVHLFSRYISYAGRIKSLK